MDKKLDISRLRWLIVFLVLSCAATAVLRDGRIAQAQQYPMMDKMAQKVIDKYTHASCAELAKQKQQPPSPEEAQMKQRVVGMLRNDPQMRAAFINKVAAPIANKLFECGMIP